MTTNPKHIILGAGGAIGNVLKNELAAAGNSVKLVSRKAAPVKGIETAKADVTKVSEVMSVVEDLSIIYLLVGLPYNLSIWQEQWPKIMNNVIEACETRRARLIFFDNVYMYGLVNGEMTEETAINPCSKKGEIRASIAEKLITQAKSGNITALIARAADFYGPFAEKSSLPYFFVIDKLAKGKKAQGLVNLDKLHSYTYTTDCGKALHLLAKTDDAFKQVWHLPTARPPLTGKQFIKIAAEKLGVDPSFSVLKKWLIKMGGIFNRQISEVYEMLYQNEYDYVFNSSKFETRFDFQPTPYDRGIAETIEHFRSRGAI